MPGVLVADDEEIVRTAVTAIIRRAGPNISPISEASTGEEAIILARQMRPEIILMDVKMPGMNGLDATRVIRKEHPRAKIIILTAYDEFTYSQEALRLGAIDYLLKPIRPASLIEVLGQVMNQIQQEEKHQIEAEAMTSLLKDALPQVEARLVFDLVHGTIGVKTASERITHQLAKTITAPSVLVVDIDRFKQAAQGMDSERFDNFCNLLVEIVRRGIPDSEHALVGQVRPGVIAVILSNALKPSDVSRNRAIGQSIRQAIEANAPVTATIGIGRSYVALDSIPASYTEALRAQWLKLYFGRNSVIHIDDLQKLEGNTRPYPVQLESELVASVRLGQRNASENLIQQIVEQILEGLPSPPEMIVTRLMELIVLCSRAVINAGAPSTEVLELTHEKIGALSSRKNRAEMLEWTTSSLKDLMDLIPNGDRGSQLVERAIIYIRDQLGQPGLELGDVAGAVHVSPSHLAHLIKEKTGMGYVKYLTLLRMEEAKKLLVTGDGTIAAIASAVGYDDPAYFHRVFRREVGMTPAAYRQQTQAG